MDDCHDFRPSAADFRAIFKALDEATAPVAGHAQPQPLAVLLHDCRGVVMGGYGAGPSRPDIDNCISASGSAVGLSAHDVGRPPKGVWRKASPIGHASSATLGNTG
jgi:hypothetical protein